MTKIYIQKPCGEWCVGTIATPELAAAHCESLQRIMPSKLFKVISNG